MEQFRRKRSQSTRSGSEVTAIVKRSSDGKLITSDGSYRGSSQTARNSYPNSESVSRSCDRDMITSKHRNAIESGQRTSKRPAGTPMKSLLADEISKQTVHAKRAPGVIARLMGLDGMPSPQSSYKQPKRSSDGFHQKTVSAASIQHQKACSNQSCKKTAREVYKDVYEVRESSQNRIEAEDHEMDTIRKKFMDVTEISDPNNYLFLKFLRDPDSLLEKHLHNLHASHESHCGLVRNLKELNPVSLHHHVSHKGRKSSDRDKYVTFRSEANDLASDARTNIVLLKPNIEVSRKSVKFSTPRSSELSDHDAHKRLPTLDISSRKSRESKELAKEITRQMRNKLNETSFNLPLSECRGYSADESSHYESYPTRKSSRSRRVESSVSKEAKKRLSERWKMSHRSEEFSFGGKGSTLGQMLSFYDSDVRLPNLDGKRTQDRAAKPLGISSKDGWRETYSSPREGYLNGRNCRKNGSASGMVSLRDKKVYNAHESQEKNILESPGCRLDSSDDVMPASEFISLQVTKDSINSQLQGSTQYPDAQPEAPVSSNKVMDQPSPVSVLDTPFMEDLSSSSECFERVSAELHGLRMQLKLLKMETGGSTSTVISSDEEEGATPSSSSQGANSNWEGSYMADMLAELEFSDNLDATWHSPDTPAGPHIFENLEKNYRYPITCSTRSDRRLLFDYLNSSIVEISRRALVNPCKTWFEAELWKMVESAMKVEKDDVSENGAVDLNGKTEWMKLGESVEEMGCEIGDMLLDELVFEVVGKK